MSNVRSYALDFANLFTVLQRWVRDSHIRPLCSTLYAKRISRLGASVPLSWIRHTATLNYLYVTLRRITTTILEHTLSIRRMQASVANDYVNSPLSSHGACKPLMLATMSTIYCSSFSSIFLHAVLPPFLNLDLSQYKSAARYNNLYIPPSFTYPTTHDTGATIPPTLSRRHHINDV